MGQDIFSYSKINGENFVCELFLSLTPRKIKYKQVNRACSQARIPSFHSKFPVTFSENSGKLNLSFFKI